MLSVFAKIFRVVPNIHQCYIESILIGFSFPFLLGAVQNSVFRWFPRKERMWAFAIASMPLAVAAGLKFAFVTMPSHAVGQVEFNISTVEIMESLFICTQGMLAVLYIQDQPAVFPSFMATQNRESIETQWSSMSY